MNAAKMIAVLLASDLIVLIGDVYAKRWAGGPVFSSALWWSLLTYVAAGAGWLAVLRLTGGSLGRAAVIWASTGVVVPVIVGRFGFGEVTTPRGWLGIGLCAVGLVLTSWH